ncbi:hypothetical protein GCM10028796_06590 [Ramlibacter monticola]|uniref:DUF4124 domain-containing protein n=1 Tax=Ramlibacter monticola TaxID=1926872 RepID=A0A937CNJ4_9BURK|nr:DUF4124 domain-containing protein [Ramlibacter monticola]MBL0389520.1 DUF4124 domain-containing protein [Ramlibacter monticola]
MKAAAVALLSLACLAPLTASAEWQWLDNEGHRVFSDQPPPPDIAPNRILKQGKGALAAMPVPAPVAANTPVGVDPSLRPSGKDKGLEEKRRQAEAAEAKKRKEDDARVTAQRSENCSRARTAKASIDSGQRLAVVNAKGEREIMDDAMRAAEGKRLDEVIARDCAVERQ